MKKLVTIDDTWKIMKELRSNYYFKRETEEVSVRDAVCRELAEDIIAKKDVPAYDMATMDGFAVKFGRREYRIVGEIYSGDMEDYEIAEDECFYVSTGSKIPKNADTVVKVEIAKIKDGKIEIEEEVERGKYVLRAGSEAKKGELILKKGTKLNPQEIAVISSLGYEKIKVYKKLRVGIFSNGDEIKKGIIPDSNSAMISAFLKKWGCEVEFLGVVGDNKEEVERMIEYGTENFDVVMTSGGISLGKKDYVIQVLGEIGDILINQVKQRPGKPLTVAIVNDKPVFALPGKPAGAFIALLSIRIFFIGEKPYPKVKAKLASTVRIPSDGFSYFLFVKLEDGFAVPVSYKGYILSTTFSEGYEPSIIASMPRSTLSDGFVIAERDLMEGEEVEVNLYD
ncbi:MAG: molybdopterin molybdotransferase MoeA [Archaeoglobaceae archaeon]|nr:molybdopterin molybdotransferase MoeA [Archaeoglobaceae archaeon]MDW8117645.1 molybdopterin molybdotransferase MoeA [Archaeoglobaceae archaeon]